MGEPTWPMMLCFGGVRLGNPYEELKELKNMIQWKNTYIAKIEMYSSVWEIMGTTVSGLLCWWSASHYTLSFAYLQTTQPVFGDATST